MTAPPAGQKAGQKVGIERDPATWACYLLLGFFTFLLNIQGNIIPFLQAELGLGYRSVSLHASAIALGMIVTGLRGDRLAGRLGRDRVLRLGTLGCVAGVALLCLADRAWISIAGCGLIGLCGSLIPSLVPAVLAQTHKRHRDQALTEAATMSYVFAILAPLLTGACVALGLGWRAAALAGGATGLVILGLFRQARLPAPEQPPASGNEPLPRAFWAYWLLLAIGVAIEFCILLWAPTYLQHQVGLPPGQAAVAAVAFPLAILAGRAVGSRLVARIAPTRLLQASLGLLALGFLPYWLPYWGSATPAVALAGLLTLGLGTALLYPLILGLAIEAAGASAAAASARFMLAIGLAILIMPAILGSLADLVGLHLAHLVLPALLAAALACLAIARTI